MRRWLEVLQELPGVRGRGERDYVTESKLVPEAGSRLDAPRPVIMEFEISHLTFV